VTSEIYPALPRSVLLHRIWCTCTSSGATTDRELQPRAEQKQLEKIREADLIEGTPITRCKLKRAWPRNGWTWRRQKTTEATALTYLETLRSERNVAAAQANVTLAGAPPGFGCSNRELEEGTVCCAFAGLNPRQKSGIKKRLKTE